VEATFVAGGSVDIVLEASTRYLGTVEFEIREKPKHGVLGPMRLRSAKENNKVVVTYTHGGDGANLADSFTFVAKIGEGSTSVPATVTLRGRPSVPRLEMGRQNWSSHRVASRRFSFVCDRQLQVPTSWLRSFKRACLRAH